MWRTQIAKIEDEVKPLLKSMAKSPQVSRKPIFPYKCNIFVLAIQAAQWLCLSQETSTTLVISSSSLLQGDARYNSSLKVHEPHGNFFSDVKNNPRTPASAVSLQDIPCTTSWSSLNSLRTSALPTYTCTTAQHYPTTLLTPNWGAPARIRVRPWSLTWQWKKMGPWLEFLQSNRSLRHLQRNLCPCWEQR